MGAVNKLEKLRNTWIAYGVFLAIIEVVTSGFVLIDIVLRIGFVSATAYVLTKQLVQKSTLVWAVGVVFGAIGTITAAISMVETLNGRTFDVSRFLLAVASAYVHVQTFRVLRDAEVKRHVMLD
jgi:hypothetical protein